VGFLEDAATGVAAGALGTHTFRIAQGFAMGAPSLIDAIAHCDGKQVLTTAVRGNAEIIEEEIEI
jgi:predicted PhzF superfamily epimerase YddE/YHI9